MSKKKFVPITVSTPEGLEAAVADYVKLKLEHAAAKAALELAIANVQADHQERIADLGEAIDERFCGIQAFCEANRAALFPPDRKSLDYIMAEVGFRKNPPSVETRRKSITFAKAAKLLLGLEWGKLFVRYGEPALDKQALIAARSRLTDEQLSAVGLEICQEEEFFVAPKSEIITGDKTAEMVA
jgi:phage host-nuclease inhibitor protein Gam